MRAKGGYVAVYRMEELTLCRMILLQLGCCVHENERVLQTRLAGRVHWLGSQSEEAVSLGLDTSTLYNSI